ncbi:MAG TPA: STAS domain-containing protein [Acidimicrobiia bacterium]|nr:STAS domain-containing protein [Acidimicrobiia bacterium]
MPEPVRPTWTEPVIGPSFQLEDLDATAHRHLVVRGEIDIKTAPDLEEALAGDAPDLVLLEMSEVSFIDSTGLRVLATTRERLEEQGRTLVVCTPEDSAVLRTMRLAGLAGDFRVIGRPDELDGQ